MKNKNIKSLFAHRHIGPTKSEIQHMLKTVSCKNLNDLIQKSAPSEILNCKDLNQTGYEKGATFKAFSPHKEDVKHEFSNKNSTHLPPPLNEETALKKLKSLSQKNQIFKNYIGQGYYETTMPAVIQRNILENPVWLTSYTPYQSEISQGRLQALLNFQTMIIELTEMEVANASLLDEGTATAEAINVAFNHRVKESAKYVLMDKSIFPQTKEVVKTRAKSAGLFVLEKDLLNQTGSGQAGSASQVPPFSNQDIFCTVVQYPNSTGAIYDWTNFCKQTKAQNIISIFIADPLSLCLFKTPGAMGADIVAGSVQRFGLSMAYGGPHAGYIATKEKYVRSLPGRIVGVSKDRHGKPALRLAIQTREQHIRKERATSNICTAQALLAVLAGMYAVYHGPEGLKKKALNIHWLACCLTQAFCKMGLTVTHLNNFFDTVQVMLSKKQGELIYNKLQIKKINVARFFLSNKKTTSSEEQMALSFSFNETNSIEDIKEILSIFADTAESAGTKVVELFADCSFEPSCVPFRKFKPSVSGGTKVVELFADCSFEPSCVPFRKFKPPVSAGTKGKPISSTKSLACSLDLIRPGPCLKHLVFKQYHSETKLLRYIHRLQEGDLSLTHSMIPLGSCTMKLNGTAELLGLSWPKFSAIHPFAPLSQVLGYKELITDLEKYLCNITGFKAISFQPNAGSQGEYAGLLMIQKYHTENKHPQRKICLIPSSAHGTNFASAVMAGLKPVTVACDNQGHISQDDLQQKLKEHGKNLSCFMLTYPSTFGFFEEGVPEICHKVHSAGGLVYLDGANMNSLIGLSQPGKWGADLCHLNLHKTFCIPHGGGGPGAGPVAVSEKLAKFLPKNPFKLVDSNKADPITAISSAPFGSAGLLMIPYMYIRLMGEEALKKATEVAILNANYMAEKLKDHYKILYKGQGGRVAHELILDFRKFKNTAEITVEDVAKRLIDYGFHAPTMNWPVPGTLMVEPTESEDKAELDRFCEAVIEIRKEIKEVEDRKFDIKNNVLKNAPHVIEDMVGEWSFPYSRERACFPLPWVREHKFWPKVSRVENAYGDINLFCSCPPL